MGDSRNSDIRLCKISATKVKEIVELFIKKIKCDIVKSEFSDNAYCITAQNPDKSVIRLSQKTVPHRTTWHIFEEKNGSRVEILFGIYKKFMAIVSILIFGLIIAVLGNIYVLIMCFEDGDISGVRIFSPVLIFTFMGLPAFVIWVCNDNNKGYEKFVDEFYDFVRSISGCDEVVMTNNTLFPCAGILHLLLGLGYIIIFFYILYAAGSVGAILTVMGERFFTYLFILIVSTYLFFMMLNFKEESYNKQLELYSVGFASGFLAVLYCLTPVWIMLFGNLGHIFDQFVIAMMLLCFVIMIVIWSIVILYLLDLPTKIIKEISFYKTVLGRNDSKFNILIMLIWIVCSIVNLPAIFLSLSYLEYLLVGKSYIFGNKITEETIKYIQTWIFSIFDNRIISIVAFKMVILLYILPILTILCIFVIKWIRNLKEVYKSGSVIPDELKKEFKEMCVWARIKEPCLVIRNSPKIDGKAEYLFPVGNVIRITTGVIEKLSREEIEVLVAHEVGHLKKHSRRYTFLDVLSQFTLFGRGFLAITENSVMMEYDADKFCLQWLLDKKHLSKKESVELMKKTIIDYSLLRYLTPSNPVYSSAIDKILSGQEKVTFREKLKLFYEVYFGTENFMVSYIQPTNEERIKRIEAVE